MNNYYVYVYLDPRKNGNFQYDEFSFQYEPIYVGKGKNNRINDHMNKYDLSHCKNKIKVNKLIKILKNGQTPITMKYKENLSHLVASKFEKKLIMSIGRINLKTGPLTNLTDGGEGSYKRVVSEKTRDKIRQKAIGRIVWNKGLTKKDIRVRKNTEKNIGSKRSNSSKKLMSKKRKDFCSTVEYKEWFKNHNPALNKEIMKARSEKVKRNGIFKGKNNPRYIDVDINMIIDLYVNKKMLIGEISKIFGVGRSLIERRLKSADVKIYRGKRK